ncbi:PfkB family carbohydrate kinase [Amycolatopsis albispora]|uniref:PfkB family carbohydrate kinase n=1 Tax=Amycolatopsis albispora TaxID=1804986 RepID=UPI001F17F1D6|nr:PfkB family carbohydrate kinase [Amycolatopsis albispora]
MDERAPEVVVAGQVGRDLVLHVPELPPPHGSAEVGRRQEMLGGKGANIAVALAQLSAAVSLIGVVGDDRVADDVLARAQADGIDTRCVVRRPGAETGLIVELLTEDGHWRYLEHLPEKLTEDDIQAAAPTLTAASSVVVQLQQPSDAALAAARMANGRVVLDGAPADNTRALLASADVLRVDQREGELLTGYQLDSAEAALRAGRELLDQGPSLVVLEAGQDGNAFVWPDGEVVLPLTGGRPVDTTGGGDAMVAALTFALTRGAGPHKAAALAVAASGATVARPGGRPDLAAGELAPHLAELARS